MTSGKKSDIAIFRKAITEDIRPWGKFRSFPYDQAASIKIITVNPGEILSLQYHRKRSEFWVIIDEGLEVTAGDRVWQPQANEEIFIPQKTAHRVRCIGQKPSRIMEIWIGESEESDIVRLDDDYGRK
ncbi:MAG: phosphomannose isomerase type II C-terminal cupin domain [Candidatus Aminicenantes bacterium]|nr:MAG: phosphomannose isomerase type II C-terminal cupin domain [Candidatus Aminicenantes bacterium]